VTAEGLFGENKTSLWCELMGLPVFRESIVDELDPGKQRQTYYFEASSGDLLSILNRFGREYGAKVPFANARQFGVRVTNEMDTLMRAGWDIGMVRKVHGERISRWRWTDEAQTS
jgi:hypothetical protein